MPPDVIVNGKFLRAPMTGVHRVAYEICNALADLEAAQAPQLRGRRFEVWHSRDGGDAARSLSLATRQIGPFDSIPWEQLTLPARQGRPVLLSLCNVGPMLAGNAVTMIHDAQVMLSPRSYTFAFRAWYRVVQTVLGRRNRALLTVSDFSRGQLARAGLAPLERIHTVHNGVDHVLRVAADPAAVTRLALAGESYVLALATTQEHKNIAVLLRAFARPELAGVKLVLFGSATREAFVAEGHAVPPGVVFAGRVSDGELRALMEGACALAFPSTTEGFGLPPLEAMLLGTPAVCAPCGALPEVCGAAALYADPHDDAAWAGVLAGLAADGDRRAALGAAGRDRAGQFTWRRAALRLLEVLDGLEPGRSEGS
ncbi:glycosyltransferase family 4 protein [Novosphingobium flavum]|uniref:Glycosyltransferase family 4 protein n=1 Tax=Novosphingobium flavum TaxID=1778672 RepID=A0A7X1FQL3_9SPHN|nr:glycosyltransferase family 1 protein [Novosphingobium flavum]MBC2665166.1 glycosyltransferase family 4 protein [Novosphingobium flavum]